MKIDIDAVKSRLGSVSNRKLDTLPKGIKTLLANDFPYVLRELKAARAIVVAARGVLDEADPRYTDDYTTTQAVLSGLLKTYDEARTHDDISE